MPNIDIDPAALSRPAISATPILPPKSIGLPAPSTMKASKALHVPPRIDLEPLYMALKSAIGENWGTYKESISLFIMGQLNQTELSGRIDHFLVTPVGEIEHLHNQLIAGIYGNVTREMPDHGVASWVSANDKPTTGTGSKPVSGDAAEQRLKTEIMQLPSRDRRRIKDLSMNEIDPHEALANIFGEHRRSKASKLAESVPASAGGLNKTNWDLEIRKRYAQPLASESGEFPDTSSVESRMLPICYEVGLTSGHVPDAAHFMSVATETFIKEVISSIFSKTRSNGPGTTGSVGSGGASSWIQTHRYRLQLEKEEEASLRGDMPRDKSGLLPIESKAASERGPLGMADVRTALEIGDCGLGQMSAVVRQIMLGYREGEVEGWRDYTWPLSYGPDSNLGVGLDDDRDIEMFDVNGIAKPDPDDYGWEGCDFADRNVLDGVLDSILAV